MAWVPCRAVSNGEVSWREKHAWSPLRKMTGENVELLEMAMDAGLYLEFVLNLNKRPVWGKVVRFNTVTGRIFVMGGRGSSKWIQSFLLKQVKVLTYPAALFEQWEATRKEIQK